MKFSTGIDIEKINKFTLPECKNNLIDFLFTKRESKQCKKKKEPHVAYAGKFCAKEAVIKALEGKEDIKNIEILDSVNGKPQVYISGIKMTEIQCSISHTDDTAVAIAIIMK